LLQVNQQFKTLKAANIDIVAVSADGIREAKNLHAKLDLQFTVAHGLKVEHMEALGLFVHLKEPVTCSPTSIVDRKSRSYPAAGAPGGEADKRAPYCEPCHFLLSPSNVVQRCYNPNALYHL
jgi:peroxiredoxin